MNRRWLIQIRQEKEYTQGRVATLCNIKRSSYTLIENGKRRPSPELAIKIGRVLGFDWTKFFDVDEKGA